MHKAGDERRQRSGRATTPGRRRAFSRIDHGRLVVRTRHRVGLRGGRRGRTADHARAVLSLSPAPTRTDGRKDSATSLFREHVWRQRQGSPGGIDPIVSCPAPPPTSTVVHASPGTDVSLHQGGFLVAHLGRGTWRHTPAAGGACGGLAIAARETRVPQCEFSRAAFSSSGAPGPFSDAARLARPGYRHRSGRRNRVPRNGDEWASPLKDPLHKRIVRNTRPTHRHRAAPRHRAQRKQPVLSMRIDQHFVPHTPHLPRVTR